MDDERFWRKVDKSGACWIWLASKDSAGYGLLRKKTLTKHYIRAHRYSWIMARGPIPDGMFVLHKCDNPSCVNPDHLFLGNNAVNQADKVSKQRQARGNRHGLAKLREDQIPQIRRLRQIGLQIQTIATLFFVSNGTIEKILSGRYWWTHV